jgi:hypothetical protein
LDACGRNRILLACKVKGYWQQSQRPHRFSGQHPKAAYSARLFDVHHALRHVDAIIDRALSDDVQ